MALVNRSSSSWMLSVQILFISIGVVSIAVVLGHYFPAMLALAAEEVPVVWECLASWLKPPYLYVVINGIIITIVASSRFQQRDGDKQPEVVPPAVAAADLVSPEMKPAFGTVELPASYLQDEGTAVAASSSLLHTFESQPVIISADLASPSIQPPFHTDDSLAADDDELVISRSTWSPLARTDSTEIPAEKPPASLRIGRRKTAKAGPEGGKGLRGVAKPRRHETLENTWRMITEGRSIPLTRHLQKSEWEHHNRQISPDPSVRKSDTFKDRTNNLTPAAPPPPPPAAPAAAGRLRKEPSLSQDELNRRVEAFIKKFNEEMRLQREESLNQYYEMINRGSH